MSEQADDKVTSQNVANVTHDDKGKFAKGNKGGPGNPYAKKAHELKVAAYAAVTGEDMTAIVRKAVEQAKKGDKAAREWVTDRLLGKATQHVEATVEGTGVLKTYLGISVEDV